VVLEGRWCCSAVHSQRVEQGAACGESSALLYVTEQPEAVNKGMSPVYSGRPRMTASLAADKPSMRSSSPIS